MCIRDSGQLDANDELAFMALDSGEQAPAGAWITDNLSTGYPRYELRVVDPLHPSEQAWVYLYRSPTLTPAFGPGYIGVTTDTVTTPSVEQHPRLIILASHCTRVIPVPFGSGNPSGKLAFTAIRHSCESRNDGCAATRTTGIALAA